MYDLVKTGSCSVVLGKNKYKNYIPYIDDKLVKITKIKKSHNEYTHLSIIKKINNYQEYYSIPDKEYKILKPSDKFYQHIKKLVEHIDINIFDDLLYYSYINYAGNKELYDTILDIDKYKDLTLWKSYRTIINFSEKILRSISYLHHKKICHLDIKPENIIVNTYNFKFKIIDFGFCSIEPFDNFVKHISGSPGYFPKDLHFEEPSPWLPKIYANDVKIVNGDIPINKYRKLIYKIDSYCFGRTLYFLKYMYKKHRTYGCFNLEKKQESKLDKIIYSLIDNDVYSRSTVDQCLSKYFNKF